MKLQPKLVLILSAVVATYATTDSLVQRATLEPLFEELESSFAQENTVRVKEALEEELELVDARCLDWTELGSVRDMFRDEDTRSAGEELLQRLRRSDAVDVMCITTGDGTVLWEAAFSPREGSAPIVPRTDALPKQAGKLPAKLTTGSQPEDLARGMLVPMHGYLSTGHGPLLVSSRPVRAEQGGPVVGKLIIGEYLAGGLLTELQERTRTQRIAAEFLGSGNSSERLLAFADRWDGEPLLEIDGPDSLTVFHLVDSALEDEPLVFSASVDRAISRAGDAAVQYALISTVTAGLLLLFVLLIVLKRIVLQPIQKLTGNALILGQDETASVEFDLSRDDEVGTLASEFDSMMRKLAKSRQALVETAREAGMSEIATGILHNVGNVLNSVNVSATMLEQKTRAMAVGDLEALHGIIKEHADDLGRFIAEDPRGQHLEPFLGAVTEQLRTAQQSMTTEVGSLVRGIDHIRTLVASQQDYVKDADVIEPVDIAEQLDRACEIAATSGGEHLAPFDVVREYAELPVARTARHKLLEILVNLMQNARQAMCEDAVSERVLTLRTEAVGDARARIHVSDTGCGIPAEHLVEVFNYGFTTKPNGHGFGLHAAANAAGEIGGSLRVHSDGCGRGATFTLEFPIGLATEANVAPVESAPPTLC